MRDHYFRSTLASPEFGGTTGGTTSSAATLASERARVQQGNEQQQSNEQQTSESNNNQNTQNNTGNYDQFLAELWNPPEGNSNNNNNAQNNSGGNEQQQQQPQNSEERLRQHLDKLDFGTGIDWTKFNEEAQNGNFERLETGVKNAVEQSYTQALRDLIPVMNQKIEASIGEAVSKATSNVNADSAVSAMNGELPYTKEKTFAPMAEAVLRQTIAKGKSPDEAIKVVDAFFQAAGDLGRDRDSREPTDSPGSRGFGGNRKPSNDIDFDQLFAAT